MDESELNLTVARHTSNFIYKDVCLGQYEWD
jgi:hypothetical protein